MKAPRLIIVFLFFLKITTLQAQAPQERLYELRTYYATEGKLDVLLDRFKNHTLKLFKKHHIIVEGFWIPLDNTDSKLVYLLSFPNKSTKEAYSKAFVEDKAWKKVVSETTKDGEIVAKMESVDLKMTDFSPYDWKNVGNRVFELRVYKATPNNLGNLLDRFKNHTIDLLEKHGIHNLIYWTPTETSQGAEDMLYYFVVHKDKASGLASFKEFDADPAWKKVKAETEAKAGGLLTVYLKSEYLMPTDFSPIK